MSTRDTGISIGAIIGAIISWALNHSVIWAIIHFIFGWLYVIYAIVCYSHQIIPALKALFS